MRASSLGLNIVIYFYFKKYVSFFSLALCFIFIYLFIYFLLAAKNLIWFLAGGEGSWK